MGLLGVFGGPQVIAVRGLPVPVGLFLQLVWWTIATSNGGALIAVRRLLMHLGQLLVALSRSMMRVVCPPQRVHNTLPRDLYRLQRRLLAGG